LNYQAIRKAINYVGLPAVVLLTIGLAQAQRMPQLRSNLIETATEALSGANVETHTDKGGCVGETTVTTSVVRKGQRAFRHKVKSCAERAELAMSRTEIGKTYWIGWSLYIPSDYEETSKGNILAQWAAYPNRASTVFPCRGIGHKLKMKSRWLEYDLQGSSQRDGNGGGFCRQFKLAIVDQALKGKWIDFIQQAKWTGHQDGFVKLWMSVDGRAYRQVVDYRGRTWWNDKDWGPYFKMGLYTGDPGWRGRSPAIVYTDEYRLGAANARCQDVAPDPSICSGVN